MKEYCFKVLIIYTNIILLVRHLKLVDALQRGWCSNLNKMSVSGQMALKQKNLCLIKLLLFIFKKFPYAFSGFELYLKK